ncbi:MAG: protein-L-isoaspartate(D-aspartate) O-methyltransferase [Thermomicrobiales bacterium]
MAQPEIDRLIRTLREQGIADESVLQAISTVPRDRFVDPDQRDRAWENHALPLSHGQTISQPYVVAAMTAALHLTGSERVLEIGTGSGYQAAVLSVLSREVVSIERIPELADSAAALLAELGYENVEIRQGDGSLGLPELAPWDAIIVTAGAPVIPQPLLAQLREDGGRMVLPVGPERSQHLVVIERNGRRYQETDLGAVAFVPLIGTGGWPDDHVVRDH